MQTKIKKIPRYSHIREFGTKKMIYTVVHIRVPPLSLLTLSVAIVANLCNQSIAISTVYLIYSHIDSGFCERAAVRIARSRFCSAGREDENLYFRLSFYILLYNFYFLYLYIYIYILLLVAVAGALHLERRRSACFREGVTRGERPPWGVGSIIRVSFGLLDLGYTQSCSSHGNRCNLYYEYHIRIIKGCNDFLREKDGGTDDGRGCDEVSSHNLHKFCGNCLSSLFPTHRPLLPA